MFHESERERERRVTKGTKQSFLFVCLSLTGKWRREADVIAM